MSYKLWHDFLLFVLCFMTLVIMCLDTYEALFKKISDPFHKIYHISALTFYYA